MGLNKKPAALENYFHVEFFVVAAARLFSRHTFGSTLIARFANLRV
jgi:hypothetical protein